MCIAIILATTLVAQKDPIKWGSIDDAEMSMTSYDADPEADAVVLCDYGNEHTVILNLNYPEGFEAESIPEDLRLSSEDQLLRFNWIRSPGATSVQIRIELTVERVKYRSIEYEGLRQFFDLIDKKLGEQIVLRRKT